MGLGRAFLVIAVIFTTGCNVELFHGLQEKDANRVYRELERSGIEVKKSLTDKRKGLFGIEVPRSQASKALEILRVADLPRRPHKGFSLVTGGGGLIPSPRQQRIKYYIALAGELEQTMENLPGVQYARVHFALPEEAGLLASQGKAPPKRASVVLKVREKAFQLAPKDVQSLVAGALPKIEPAAVSVVVQFAAERPRGRSAYASVGPFSVSPSTRIPLLVTLVVLLLFFVGLVVALVMSRRSITTLRESRDGVDESPAVTT